MLGLHQTQILTNYTRIHKSFVTANAKVWKYDTDRQAVKMPITVNRVD